MVLVMLGFVLAVCIANIKDKNTAYSRFMAMYPFALTLIGVAYYKFF